MKYFSSLLFVLLLMLTSFTTRAEYQRGDVDQNGQVTIGDVTCLIDYLLNGTWGDEPATPYDEYQRGDVDQNGQVTIGDVTFLIDYLLSGEWPEENPSGTQTFTVNGVTFKMVFVEGGTFMMGASDNDPDAFDIEKPAHQVTLSSYNIGETEVTQELWVAVMGSNPSSYSSNYGYVDNLQLPVEWVSWQDCQTFITKLNELTGKSFRLPTEAEWEFAARGGNESHGYKYAGSNDIDEIAWYYDNCYVEEGYMMGRTTHTVATKAPNELGLYDMTGNVEEVCLDRLESYSSEAQTNPTGPVTSSTPNRACRGGCISNKAQYCRLQYRGVLQAWTSKTGSCGLRLALDEDNSPKFRLSKTVVTLSFGKSESVNILNGSGSYTSAGGTEFSTQYVLKGISGDTLTVESIKSEGVTTVHVTDNSTGATAVLAVVLQP